MNFGIRVRPPGGGSEAAGSTTEYCAGESGTRMERMLDCPSQSRFTAATVTQADSDSADSERDSDVLPRPDQLDSEVQRLGYSVA